MACQIARQSSSTTGGSHLFPTFVVSMKERPAPSSCARNVSSSAPSRTTASGTSVVNFSFTTFMANHCLVFLENTPKPSERENEEPSRKKQKRKNTADETLLAHEEAPNIPLLLAFSWGSFSWSWTSKCCVLLLWGRVVLPWLEGTSRPESRSQGEVFSHQRPNLACLRHHSGFGGQLVGSAPSIKIPWAVMVVLVTCCLPIWLVLHTKSLWALWLTLSPVCTTKSLFGCFQPNFFSADRGPPICTFFFHQRPTKRSVPKGICYNAGKRTTR